MAVEIVRVGASKDQLGEGPVWDAEEQALYWIDSLAGVIHRLDPASGERRDWRVPGVIGSLALRRRGGAVVALDSGFHLFDFASGSATAIADPEADEPRTRLNDGKVDRQGRFLCGSMSAQRRDLAIGALYRLDPDLSVERLLDGIIVSNGPCFSPDGATFYFADSPRRVIWAFDYDTGSGRPANRRVLVDTDAHGAAPDGATVDAEGYLWSALVIGGRVARFAPDGRLDREVALPLTHPSSVAFGGPGLDVLYVTSISESMTRRAPDRPEEGGLFAIHGLGVRGLPEPRFAG